MDSRIETVTSEWRYRACEMGIPGLHALSDASFSGAVSANGTQAFLVNGRIVGIIGGTIESFREQELSALESDDPALPLLCAMLSKSTTTEAEYYTGETPLDEVHKTLSSGSFTGYLELSENVFSGDYFVLYYGGTAQYAAILGTQDRVITGSEAYERASEEVGIYQVRSADIEVIDIPEPSPEELAATRDIESANSPAPTEPEPVDPSPETTSSHPQEDPPEPEPAESSQSDPTTIEKSTPTENTVDRQVTARRERSDSSDDVEDESESNSGPLETISEIPNPTLDESPGRASRNRDTHEPLDELLTIPALDPEQTVILRPAEDTEVQAGTENANTPSEPDTSEEPDEEPEAAPNPEEQLAALTETLESVERENEQLRNRIQELEAELDSRPEPEPENDTNETTVPPRRAIDGTNLLVRYGSKAQPTLDDAVDGNTPKSDVADNLRIEWHTDFDVDSAVIEGQPFTEFITNRLEYQFADWLLEDLLFELRDTGQQSEFSGLFESIPDIDRVEFDGTIPVHSEQSGERSSEAYPFDMVFRNGMGEPIIVANVHDDRTPTDAGPVGELLEDSNRVGTERKSLSAALFVTKSYFEPAALETVAEATSGGFLTGGSEVSYVNVSRKHGFHLCLVEARNDTFHLNVPDR